MKYKHLTEKNPRELEEMHAAGLLTAEPENTHDHTSAQNRSSLEYIVPTGIFHKCFVFFSPVHVFSDVPRCTLG